MGSENPEDYLSVSFNSLSISPEGCGSDQCSELPPAMQVNGRKIIGPPLQWSGPPPADSCELYINKIPKDLTEHEIVPHFLRFGQIYEFRLMLDFSDRNRGYGYVKYTNEKDAARAREVMNHFYILPGKLLEIRRSYNKCRLFVGNIPKQLSREQIDVALRKLFPKIKSIVLHSRISDGAKNRGFAFIDFPTHQDALEVKKRISPGTVRKWGNDLKIVWANPERYIDEDIMSTVKTLFVRNVDFSVNTRELYTLLAKYIPKSEVLKISRVREFAFIDFNTRKSAEKVLYGMTETVVNGYKLEFEWALPPSENSVHSLQNTDFDAELRLKCIANYWSVPIIIFGRVIHKEGLQYAAVMLQFFETIRTIFLEMRTENLTDIHSRICEVVVAIIEGQGGFPAANYIIKVEEDNAHIVGAITDFANVKIVVASDIANDLFLYLDEIRDLSMAVGNLSQYSHQGIAIMYQNALHYNPAGPYIEMIVANNRIVGCINPSYRKKPPLSHGLSNAQIILVLCHVATGSNVIFPVPYMNVYNFKSQGIVPPSKNGLSYTVIRLLPAHFAQSRNNEFRLPVVCFPPPMKGPGRQITLQVQNKFSNSAVYFYQNI